MKNRFLRQRRQRGQATTEMVIIIPVLVLLAGVSFYVLDVGWQQIKLQQAANHAARIEGQERIAGGIDPTAIKDWNKGRFSGKQQLSPRATSSVYDKIAYAVVSRFSRSDYTGRKLRINQGARMGDVVDEIVLEKDIQLPSTLSGMPAFGNGLITLKAKAYGGEDTRVYGLPRWGVTGTGNNASRDPFFLQNKEAYTRYTSSVKSDQK